MSTQTNDGGPAFPHFNPDTEVTHSGMSLRDWFAGQAITGILSNKPLMDAIVTQCAASDEKGSWTIGKCFSHYALEVADAMLAARNKQPEKP